MASHGIRDRVAIVDHGRVIAIDTPRGLIRSLGAEQVVEVELAEGAAVPSGLFATTAGVLGSRIDGPVWTLQVSAAHRAVPAGAPPAARGSTSPPSRRS